MKIDTRAYSQTALIALKDYVIPTLTEQQKKIALIIGVIFTSLAAYYFLNRYFGNSKNLKEQVEQKKKIELKKEVEQNKEVEQVKKSEPKKEVEQNKEVELKKEAEPEKFGGPRQDAEQKKEDEQEKDIPESRKITDMKGSKGADKTEEEPTLEETEKEQDLDKAEKGLNEENLLDKDKELTNAKVAAADRKAKKALNILILGENYSGKSTLCEVLKDPFYCGKPVPQNEPKIIDVYVSVDSKEKHTFHLLDTAGTGHSAKSNEQIAQQVKDTVVKYFGGQAYDHVDAVILISSVGVGLKHHDIEFIKHFVRKELPTEVKKLFILTNADSVNDKSIDNFRKEIAQHPQLADHIKTDFGGEDKILFSGILPKTEVDFYSSKAVQLQITRIARMQKAIIQGLLPDDVTEEERADIVQVQNKDFEERLPDYLKNFPYGVEDDLDN